eukprot:Gb_09053 [translate_table: standard]
MSSFRALLDCKDADSIEQIIERDCSCACEISRSFSGLKNAGSMEQFIRRDPWFFYPGGTEREAAFIALIESFVTKRHPVPSHFCLLLNYYTLLYFVDILNYCKQKQFLSVYNKAWVNALYSAVAVLHGAWQLVSKSYVLCLVCLVLEAGNCMVFKGFSATHVVLGSNSIACTEGMVLDHSKVASQ